MYAIVEIAGQQFKVEEGKKIFVHRLDIEEGKNIKFDHVLLVEEDGKISVGEPVVKDSFVEGKIVDHVRGDKVIVFKKKRKKGYRIKNGHRQNFTQIEIININGKTSQKKPAVKKEAIKVAVEPVAEKKSTVKKETKKPAARKEKAEVKKPAGKKTAEKKPAVKKSTEKKSPKGKA
ncbi:MAG: 50S ribosomal protein L21 [Bacteroidia bacterium]|nr:50S ribosomal protein L21 [Bacteroidia bacterium]